MKHHSKLAILALSLLTLCVGCGGQSSAAPSISYDTSANTKLVQLSRVGGNILSGPLFTLLGNGQLTYQDTASSSCMQSTLTSAQIHDVLNTVITTHHFFSFKDGNLYGKILNPDAAHFRIAVNANGTQKSVDVASASDADSTTLNAIVTYLMHFAPPNPQPC